MNPVIKTDDYYVNHGRVIFDMGYVDEVDVMYIAETLKQYLGGEKRPVFDNTQKEALPRTRQDAIYDLFNAWLDGDPRAF